MFLDTNYTMIGFIQKVIIIARVLKVFKFNFEIQQISIPPFHIQKGY